MPERSFLVIRVFERRDGNLVRSRQEITTYAAAEKRAKMLARHFAGAVITEFHDADDGSRHDATYLTAFGDVPEPYVELKVDA